MISLAERGEKIIQQTRSFDADTDTTFSMRDKEEANDYRYFPEPDLAPFQLSESFINNIKQSLPALPATLQQHYLSLGLNEYDASQLCDEKATADYFDEVAKHTNQYKAIANWMLGPLRQIANEKALSIGSLDLAPERLAQLVKIVEEGKVNFSVASLKILPAMLQQPGKHPLDIATELNLLQVSNTQDLETWADEVISKMADKVAEYKKGKKGLIGLFVGEMKKLSKGKADPKVATQILEEKLR